MSSKDGNPALSLGEIIRRQREISELSMRQFASMAGISNPYLSQIERGLREPSDKVMEATTYEGFLAANGAPRRRRRERA